MFITRHQFVVLESKQAGKGLGLGLGVLSATKKLRRFTLMAEGIADEKVIGIPADEKVAGSTGEEWLQNPHLCLFRIETPSTLSDATHQDPMEARLEAKANIASLEKSRGETVKYGQEVQLRHVHSDRLLSLNLLNAANAPGAWSVSVNTPSDFLCRHITLFPFNRSNNIGDPIRYGEPTSIVFQTDNLKYYLQSEFLKSSDGRRQVLLDINSTHKPANWKFMRYMAFSDTDRDAIKYGETLIIKYSKLGMFMALTQPPQVEKTHSKGAQSDVKKPAVPARVPMVTKAEVEDYSHFWVLQSMSMLKGGCLAWDTPFFIKNALTGMYLGPDLKLLPQPNRRFSFFFPKPDSFTESSVVPNGYPLMIKSSVNSLLSPDHRQSNEESLDHLIPPRENEGLERAKEISLAMVQLELDQRESLFELDYVQNRDSRFFNLITGLIPKFVETRLMVEDFKRKAESSGRKSWEISDALEKRLTMMLNALDYVTDSLRKALGEEFEEKQMIFAGVGFHTVLIELASNLHTLFTSPAVMEVASELLINEVKKNLVGIWNLLNEIVLDNEISAKKVSVHWKHLRKLLKYDTRRIGSLLTEVFRLVDPDIPDPKPYFHKWCKRLDNLTKSNLQEQVIYMGIIRNLCEIGDTGLVEYQREITKNLFQSENAINLIEFTTKAGEIAIHFGEKGGAVSFEEFKLQNPDLIHLLKENEDRKSMILLRDLGSEVEEYVEYVQAAMMLYHAISRGRCHQARDFLRDKLHITAETVFRISQDLDFDIEIRQASLFLLEALCLSVPPYEPYADNDTTFNYADIKLEEVHSSKTASLMLIDYSKGETIVHRCLEFVFEFWMAKWLPEGICCDDLFESKNPRQYYRPVRYVLGMLRLTLAIVEYKHCTELWGACTLRAVQYLLAGFTHIAPKYKEYHWGATLIAQALKMGEVDRRIRIVTNLILNCVMNSILAVKKLGRRTALGEVIRLFVSQSETMKNPLFGSGLMGVSVAQFVSKRLKKIASSGRTQKVLDQYFNFQKKTAKKLRKTTSCTPLLSEGDAAPLAKVFSLKHDFKDTITHAPVLREAFIRLILDWPSFNTTQKNQVIYVLNELFKETRLFNKSLKSSDIISLGPVSQVYNRLRWIRDNLELNSLIIRAKFEITLTGKSQSLLQIIQMLEYLTNFCHPRNGSGEFLLEKTKNIARQLELHKYVMAIWSLIGYLEKVGIGHETPCILLKSGLISFLFYFANKNKSNFKELSRLLSPSMITISVIQFSSLLRAINDYEHLSIRDVTRLFIYILEDLEVSDKGIKSMIFFEKLMVDKSGQLKQSIQNVASSLLSEKLAKALSVRKQRPQVVANLIEMLALSAEDNPPVITQCRHLLPLSQLQSLIVEEEHPLLLNAFIYILFTVYVKKPSSVKTVDKVEDLKEEIEHVLKVAIELMKSPADILKLVTEGSYALVYYTKNPAYTDLHINLPSNTPELSNWVFLCKEWEGRVTGVFRIIPDILEALEVDSSITPALTKFFYALTECRTKVERMQEQTEGLLCFAPMLKVFDTAIARVRKTLEILQVTLIEEAFAVARGDTFTLSQEAIQQVKAPLAASMLFEIDPQAMDYLEVDYTMNQIMIAGYRQYTEQFRKESEEGYINTIVSLIDQRLAEPQKIVTKKDLKDLIASLAKKIRGLQKLFTSSKQRTLFFKIMEGIVPDEEHASFKIKLNPLFHETHLVEYALSSILRNEAHEEVLAALSFIRKLFLLQTREFMDRFRLSLNENSLAYPLFMKIQTELNNGKVQILEVAKESKTLKPTQTLSNMQTVVTSLATIVKPKKTEGVRRQNELLVGMLYFIQICCDNCNEPFQIFCREQRNTEGKADVDLVSALANFLIDIRSAKDYLFSTDFVFETLNAALSAFTDFVTGPCSSNQLALGNNVRIYLVMNTLIAECQGRLEADLIDIHQNCIQFLNTLLEGHPDPSVSETMGRFLDIGMLARGCQSAYERYVVGHEEALSLELSTLKEEQKGVVEAALQQAILLFKLRLIGVAHEELTKFETPYTDTAHCYAYFAMYTGYVEITRNNVLEIHLFPIPWKCKYVTPSTRNSVIVDVSRSSHQEKLQDFLHQVEHCRREMMHQQLLHCSKTFKSFSSHWQLFGKLAYYFALIINLVLLYAIQNPDFSDLKNDVWAFTSITVLGILQTFTYMGCFFFNLVEYYPQTLLRGQPKLKEFEMDEFFQINDSDSLVMTGVHQSILKGGEMNYTTTLQNKLKEVLFNFDLYYTYGYFLISIIAIYEPVFYPFLLLDVVKQTPELGNVLKSVTLNFRQLILTLWLGVIIIYLFSIGSFHFYQDYYDSTIGAKCDDLLNCFFSTLNYGIRLDGEYMSTPDSEDYWWRMVIDMLFYMIIIIILLNIIFGIIIDTFAELRDERNGVLDDIHNCCYICNKERSVIEQKGNGWSYHFMCEHSPFAYLSFLVYIKEKKIYDCSGLEKLVKESFESFETGFMPTTSIQMAEFEEQEEDKKEEKEGED